MLLPLCLAVLTCDLARAQQGAPKEELRTSADLVRVPERLPVELALDRSARAQKLRLGEVLSAIALVPVRSRGTEYVRAGAVGHFQVVQVRTRSFLGRPARVELQAIDVEAVDGTSIALKGSWVVEGEDLTVETVSAAGALCCLAVFNRGGEVRLGKGGAFTAQTLGGDSIRIHATPVR